MIDFGLFKVKKCVRFILHFLANPKDVHFVVLQKLEGQVQV